MDKISTILVPFDFSVSAKRALEYAVAFVGRNDDIHIVLAHISGRGNFQLLPENFKKIKEKYSKVLKNNLEWIIQDGRLTESLLDIQKSKKIDLIIMGTVGTYKKVSKDQTNTSKLVLEAHCPVLVVPQRHQEFQVNNIALVLGTKEIDDTQDLGTVLEFARRFNAKVHVLTIENQSGNYGYSKEDESNENNIQYYLENFYAEHVFIKNDDVVEGILTYVQKHDLDLIAILPRNHAKQSQPSEGLLTQLLTLHSKVPMLAIE